MIFFVIIINFIFPQEILSINFRTVNYDDTNDVAFDLLKFHKIKKDSEVIN